MHAEIQQFLRGCSLALVPGLIACACAPNATAEAEKGAPLAISARADNDLCQVMQASACAFARYDTPAEAVDRAAEHGAVLFLADGYPDTRTAIDPEVFKRAAKKHLRVYVEYPRTLPSFELGDPKHTEWERLVVARDAFGDALAPMRILMANGCTFLPAKAKDPWLVAARVAGYDTAVYGLPDVAYPILFEIPRKHWIVATTKLSGFITARFAPAEAWKLVWERILRTLLPDTPITLQWVPNVRPAYGKAETLPPDFEKATFDASARWYHDSRLLVDESRMPEIRALLLENKETIATPGADAPIGDGHLGILEGYASPIAYDGSQVQRIPLRADCNTESAMVLALDWHVNKQERSKAVAQNLIDYVYSPEGMCGGARGNPKHPAYGLVSWGAISPLWEVANYGDDSARVIFATAVASAALETDQWDVPLLRSLLANLRTTGTKGFRGDRIDMPQLEHNGWKYYYDKPTVSISPHFECYLWAAFLWAYGRTHYTPFIEHTKEAIQLAMERYPEGWLWRNSAERVKMLLPLAWLVRAEDTPEHRAWLDRIAKDVLALQQPCGAIIEIADKPSDWSASKSNAEYGTTESQLIQNNGDPASDQLYTTPFALLALHEAYAATADPALKAAEDKVAQFMCRIQIRAEKYPQLNGTWFRAFDFGRWEFWAASADVGWGAWCVESGWGNAWATTILALRQQNISIWDFTEKSAIGSHLDDVIRELSQNDGSPWQGEPWKKP